MTPQRFRPGGEIPKGYLSSSRIHKEKYLQFKYTVSVHLPEKVSICLKLGLQGIVG